MYLIPKAHHTLSVGLQLGMVYKKVNTQQLLWDEQYNDGYFDSDLPSGKSFSEVHD